MDWQNSFFEIPLLITAFIALYVAAILRNYRTIKILSVVSFLLVSAGFWSIFYSLEIWTADLNLQIIFAKLEYLGICVIPPLWISFCARFAFPKKILKPKYVFGYYFPFIVTLVIVFTNNLHHWFWKDSVQILYQNTYLLSNTYGFWFWIHTFLSYGLTIIGSVLVIAALVRKRRVSIPVFLIGFGVLIPILGSLTFIFKIHIPFDMTPFTVTLSGVLLAISMIQFNFFNIKPIAKSTLFSSLTDPVFFINNEHVVIEANKAAQMLFNISEYALLNDSIETIFKNKTGSIPELNPHEPVEIVLEGERVKVVYQVITTTVLQKEKAEGYLITLKDISAAKLIDQAQNEEVSFASFMNEVVELSVNSPNIDLLLHQVMHKLSDYLGSDLIMIVRDLDKQPHSIELPDKESLVMLNIDLKNLTYIVDRAQKQRKTQIIHDPQSLKRLTNKTSLISGLLAFPLLVNSEVFGVIVLLFRDELFPSERQISFIEYSMTQIMLSVSKLLILEGLEKSVAERTNQVVSLNTELVKNLSFLNRLVDTSPNLVFSLNPQDEITFCNDQFIHEFGIIEKKDVIGKPLSVVFKGRDQGLWKRILEISHNGNRSGQYECVFNLNLGSQKLYLVNKATIFSPENVPQENIFILINLTKQKNQENKLIASEKHLRSLFESMPVVLLEEDQSNLKVLVDEIKKEHGEGSVNYIHEHPEIIPEFARLIKITDCNQMALDFYGFSTREELFNSYPQLISKSTSTSLQKQIEGYLIGKTDFETEDTRLKTNGEQVFINLRLHIPPENTKDFSRVLVSAVDITKRKITEKALLNSEEKFRNIVQQSVDGIILFDRNGKIIEWNIADEKITGYAFADIQNLHVLELIVLLAKESAEQGFSILKDQLHNALYDGISPLANQIVELTLSTKNGSRVMINAIVSRIEIGHDFVGSIIIRDVSGIKKSQAEVQKLASAVHEISEGLVIANNIGETEYVNLAVEKITGYSSEELLGKNLFLFIKTNYTPEQIQANESGLREGKIQRGKVICTRKDGSQYTLQYNIAPIDDEQGNRNYVSVISDVSQSELLEQQNRQAQKLEAIGSLAAGVAHEINTPTQYVGNNLLFIRNEFSAILQLLEKNQKLLNQAQSGELVAESIEQLHQEEKEADLEYLTNEIPRAIDESLEGIGRVTKIVQAIKEFSHPSMDEKTPVDLNRAIDTTITVSRNEWKYVADLIPHYDEKLPTVICSPGEINQVILNLITNASHAIKEQIEKGIYTKGLIEIFTFSKENSVEIHVKDNGAGIPEEYREKVFNPFFTTKPVGMGTGQGLSISYKVIVNKHNGNLGFETEIGKGTTFIITLPTAVCEKPDLLINI